MSYTFGISGFWTGTATFSGDGSTTTFNLPHGMNPAPEFAWTFAESGNAAGDRYVSSIDSTNIVVVYVSAPLTGTNNVTLRWFAGRKSSVRNEIRAVISDTVGDDDIP